MTQDIPITALDHRRSVSGKVDHHVAQRRSTPGLARDALLTEDCDCKVAIGRTGFAAVDDLEHQLHASPLLWRQSPVLRNGAAPQSHPQSRQCSDPVERIVVERDLNSHRTIQIDIRQEQKGDTETVHLEPGVSPVLSIHDGLRIEAERLTELQMVWRSGDDEHACVCGRGPEDGLYETG